VLAYFAEPQGGKACEAGLKRKTENYFQIIFLLAIASISEKNH